MLTFPQDTDYFNIKLDDREYMAIADFVHQKAGINLKSGKKELVRTRLFKRMRALKLNSFKDYFHYVTNDESGDEIVFLLDALATNLTSFFREPQHFKFMAQTMLPELEEKRRREKSRRLRIWSAACSSGEEAYTIAMVVMGKSPYFAQGGDFKILGTDISTKVLQIAQKGVYGPQRVKTISPMLVKRFFTPIENEQGESLYKVKDEMQKLLTFRRLNLMDPLPFPTPLDLIFCRNVMIYFDQETIASLINKFYTILAPGAYLFIGHSESLSSIEHKFRYVGPCIYRKE